MQKQLLFITLLITSLTGCMKETSFEGGNLPAVPGNGGNNNGNNNSPEVGVWKFLDINIVSAGTIEGDLSGIPNKTTSSLDLTSINNSGTVSFDGKNMAFNNVAFSFDGVMRSDLYIGGIKTTSVDVPVIYDNPATSAAYDYSKIGNDSLYFSAALLSAIAAIGIIQPEAAGAKLKWNGDKMSMTIVVATDKTETIQGVTAHVNNKATIVINLQKQ